MCYVTGFPATKSLQHLSSRSLAWRVIHSCDLYAVIHHQQLHDLLLFRRSETELPCLFWRAGARLCLQRFTKIVCMSSLSHGQLHVIRTTSNTLWCSCRCFSLLSC